MNRLLTAPSFSASSPRWSPDGRWIALICSTPPDAPGGVPARFIRFPDSYHGGWTPWRMVHRYWASLGWWRAWLGEGL